MKLRCVSLSIRAFLSALLITSIGLMATVEAASIVMEKPVFSRQEQICFTTAGFLGSPHSMIELILASEPASRYGDGKKTLGGQPMTKAREGHVSPVDMLQANMNSAAI